MSFGTRSCMNCGNALPTLRNQKVENSLNEIEPNEFYCPACGFRKCNLDIINTPLERGSIKTFQCYMCKKSFKTYGCLKRHVNSHSGARPFHCDLCDKYFSTKAAVKRHKIIHTGECPFECSTCKRKFNQISNLRKHLIIHNNNCPYHCDVCGKGFNQRSNLKKHKAVHESSKTDESSHKNRPEYSVIPPGLVKKVKRPVVTFIKPANS